MNLETFTNPVKWPLVETQSYTYPITTDFQILKWVTKWASRKSENQRCKKINISELYFTNEVQEIRQEDTQLFVPR